MNDKQVWYTVVMIGTKKYRIKCLKCNGSNTALISEVRDGEFAIDLDTDHRKNPIFIISGRYRGDMNYGWECACGNDSRLAREEFKDIDSLVINGGKQAIAHITQSLKVEDDKKFRMEEN